MATNLQISFEIRKYLQNNFLSLYCFSALFLKDIQKHNTIPTKNKETKTTFLKRASFTL